MVRDQGIFRIDNPWPKIGWAIAAGILVAAFGIGFGFLGRYQQNGSTLDLFNAICRGLGITSDRGPEGEPRPPLRTATNIAWTGDTLAQISAGNSDHGAFIALNCAACHGQGGLSTSTFIPTLAGMDAAVIYKQLDDYRSDKRLWGVMGAMAKSLSPQASADVAAFFATQRDGLPPLGSNRVPESGRSLREADPAMRLVFAGDPQRGIPPCSACHGPGGYKLGAPALQGQRAAYIERQLASFAQGMRENDISEQMRVIAKQLTPDEMREVAAFYGAPAVPPTTGATASH
jgi:cytochrome c553